MGRSATSAARAAAGASQPRTHGEKKLILCLDGVNAVTTPHAWGEGTPGEAQKRPRLRALRNVERRFHLTTLVEETRLIREHSFSVDEVWISGMSVVS